MRSSPQRIALGVRSWQTPEPADDRHFRSEQSDVFLKTDWCAERVFRGMMSSGVQGRRMPKDAAYAAFPFVATVVQYLTDECITIGSERSAQRLYDLLWQEMCGALTRRGQVLPIDLQEAFIRLFTPHAECELVGAHPVANQFAHLWHAFVQPCLSPHTRFFVQSREMEEVGDELRDQLPFNVRLALANMCPLMMSHINELEHRFAETVFDMPPTV